jgi:hypothetical protein
MKSQTVTISCEIHYTYQCKGLACVYVVLQACVCCDIYTVNNYTSLLGYVGSLLHSAGNQDKQRTCSRTLSLRSKLLELPHFG